MKIKKNILVKVVFGLILVASYFVKIKVPCGGMTKLGVLWDGVCDVRLIRYLINPINIFLLTIVLSVYFLRKKKFVWLILIVSLYLIYKFLLGEPRLNN